MNNKHKFAVIALAILLVVFFVFLIWEDKRQDAQYEAKAQEYEQELRPYRSEQSRLEYELEELEYTVAHSGDNMGSVIVLFSAPDARIMTDCLPKMKEYGYPGVVAVSDEFFPGGDGCLTVEDVKLLIKEGWELCLTVTPESDPAALSARIEQSGLPKAVCAYFPQSYSYAEWKDRLVPLNLIAVIERYLPQDNGEDLWNVKAYGSNESKGAELLRDNTSTLECAALTVGYQNRYELYAENNFNGMLATLKRNADDGKLAVANVTAARERSLLREAVIAAAEENTGKQREELNAALKTVQEQINAINKKYGSMK